ncbi:hypothetical protein ACFVT8_21260 [Lysinibacillus sp. NPDC058147]
MRHQEIFLQLAGMPKKEEKEAVIRMFQTEASQCIASTFAIYPSLIA